MQQKTLINLKQISYCNGQELYNTCYVDDDKEWDVLLVPSITFDKAINMLTHVGCLSQLFPMLSC
jgi:hypothetical protein